MTLGVVKPAYLFSLLAHHMYISLFELNGHLEFEKRSSHFSSEICVLHRALPVLILASTGNPNNKQEGKDKVTCSNPSKQMQIQLPCAIPMAHASIKSLL